MIAVNVLGQNTKHEMTCDQMLYKVEIWGPEEDWKVTDMFKGTFHESFKDTWMCGKCSSILRPGQWYLEGENMFGQANGQGTCKGLL